MDVPRDIPSLGLERLHVRPDVGEILIPAPSVDDEVDVVVLDLGDDGVVDGAALLVGEHGEGAGAGAEGGDVGDDELLEEGDGVAAGEAEAAHVGDVEEAAVGAAVEGGVHDGVLVLDGHAPPGEGHHLPPVLHMELVQRRPLELGLGGGGGGGEGAARLGGGGDAPGEERLGELPQTTSSSSHCGVDGEKERGGVGERRAVWG